MAVKNDPEKRFANGSIGTVIEFTSEGFPIVDFKYPMVIYPDEWELKSVTVSVCNYSTQVTGYDTGCS